MLRQIIAAALMSALLPLAVVAQTQTSQAPAPAPAAHDVPKSYIPGPEQFMGVILSQHAKLWYAGQARNWELAEFELGEIKEVMSDLQDLYPKFKNLPFGDMLDAVITQEIVELEKAIEAKDFRKFAAGYDKLTAACNTCHETTENAFVVIRRPAGSRPFPNQEFRPRKK